jgi:hypothetical protein
VKVSIKDISEKEYNAYIEKASNKDIINLTNEWKFNWNEIFKNDELTFKITKDNDIQGLLKLKWENSEYVISGYVIF